MLSSAKSRLAGGSLALILFVLFSSASVFSQQFHSLDGIESPGGQTLLIYRLGSDQFIYNPIFKLNVTTGYEQQIIDAHSIIYQVGADIKSVTDFEFFPGDTINFMNIGDQIYMDYGSYIARNDSVVFGYYSPFLKVDISKQNPQKVFVFDGGGPVRSWDGGYTFPEDSIPLVTNFIPIALADFDDNVLFGFQELGYFAKNSFPVDTAKVFFDDYMKILYDVNQFHIYRVNKTYGGYSLNVSNNKGNAFSWTKTYQSENPFYITIDSTQSGVVYLADGRRIYKSINNGYTFTEYKSLPSKLVGIYKKPDSEILYAASQSIIFKITPDSVVIIKSLPLPDEVFEWFPLSVGNTWVFSSYWVEENSGFPPTYHFVGTKYLQAVGDTSIENKSYFILENDLLDQFVFEARMYLRVDSLTGKIFRYWESLNNEYLFNDLNAEVGDIVYYPPNIQQAYYYLFDESEFTFWNETRLVRTYFENAPCGCGHTYVKGLGLGGAWFNEFGGSEDVLKGAIINGIVYGDTTNVVDVENYSNPIPTEFKLEQNYPNPFNPSTKISWQSPVGNWQTLKVFDVLGKEVTTLVDEYRDAGNYDIEFKATQLPSGIYFYQLKSGDFIETRKMVLLK